MAELHVTVGADIDGRLVAARAYAVVIPPGYKKRDTDALVVRSIEDTAFRAVREAYGRQPTRAALIAAAARLGAIERVLNEWMDGVELHEQIKAILAKTNNEVTAEWGDDPEGQ